MPVTRKLSKFSITEIEAKQADKCFAVDDGRDYSKRIVWQMNQKRHMRNGVVAPKPEAPQVAPASIQKKRKPRKRSYSVVQKAIGAV